MRAARWVVIGTALVAAGTAFHLLLSPVGGSRSGARPRETASSGSSSVPDRSATGAFSGGPTSAGSGGGVGDAGRAATAAASRGGPPLDEIDAESREAMRSFLRESAQDGK